MVLNFASFLEENKYFEDAFRVYEKVKRNDERHLAHLAHHLLVAVFFPAKSGEGGKREENGRSCFRGVAGLLSSRSPRSTSCCVKGPEEG